MNIDGSRVGVAMGRYTINGWSIASPGTLRVRSRRIGLVAHSILGPPCSQLLRRMESESAIGPLLTICTDPPASSSSIWVGIEPWTHKLKSNLLQPSQSVI